MYPRLFDSAAHLLVLPIFALLLFLGIFVMVVARTMHRAASDYAAIAALPLTQEEERP
jgi:cbb3-type cytochrome oxidase subunit 3